MMAERQKLTEKPCSVGGCPNPHVAKGFCGRHYTQNKRHGCILSRTRSDPNEFVDSGDATIEIITCDNRGLETGRFITDSFMGNLAKGFKWRRHSAGYCVAGFGKNQVYLHHLVIGCPLKGYLTDHVDGNTSDNRETNLRIVTYSQNAMNSRTPRSNTSGFKGVHFDKRAKRWKAFIKTNGHCRHLGCYDKIDDAVLARREAEVKHFGEHRRAQIHAG